jgi:hypothetical protein
VHQGGISLCVYARINSHGHHSSRRRSHHQPTTPLTFTADTMAESSVQNQSQPRRAASLNHTRSKRPHGRWSKGRAKSAPVSTSGSEPDTNASTETEETEDDDSNDSAVQTQIDPQQDESQDQDLCWICAEPIRYYAVSECNHRTCHVCAIRLRALYKKLDCTFCKVRLPYIAQRTFNQTNVRNHNGQLSSPSPLMPPSRLILQRPLRSKMKSWRYRSRLRR